MYKLTDRAIIIRLSDGAEIPMDTENIDYQEYLRWLDAGNTAEPADLPNPNTAILAQIASIEAQTGVVGIVREFMLASARDYAERQAAELTASGTTVTAEQLLAQNIGYQSTLAIDNEIKALEAQLT